MSDLVKPEAKKDLPLDEARWAAMAEMYERLTPAQKEMLEPLIRSVENRVIMLWQVKHSS